ncbi:ABC transporter ATP-binding protein [Plantibacter sp. YIM 135347]|uniref:ABC transporter ATP-binding protein n=1 Tax=Plantibacter sp. YIM 135347 TaxID=3423919 RepID=UPI003D346633
MTIAQRAASADTGRTGTTPALEIDDVALDFVAGDRRVRGLDGATLVIEPGTSVAVVGESGSGKSTLASLIGRLQPDAAVLERGTVRVDGIDVASLDTAGIRAIRRSVLGFVPQDPIGSLDPTMRIGRQLALVLRLTGQEAGRRAQAALLGRMQIADPERVLRLYPHQVSGGMAQRISIAIAMCRKPRILIADEPTAALDSQVREGVIGLMFDEAEANGTTILWLSHDLPAVSRWCDEIAVMYAGRVVEHGPARDVLAHPVHPYSSALASTDPSRVAMGERLLTIAGTPPVLHEAAHGCAFVDRCPVALDECRTTRPTPVPITIDGAPRESLCLRTEELVAAERAGAPIVHLERIRS